MGKKYLWNYLLLAAVGLLTLCLTGYIEWYGDALLYRFSFATGEPVATAGDLLASQLTHYMVMNGRIWAHVLCQAFSAMWGQAAFAVCNAAVYVALTVLFAEVCGMSWRNLRQLALSALTVLFICDTSYIANCQIGYVWTSAVTLGFIIMYAATRRPSPAGALRMAALFVLGLLAGNGNEAIAIGTGAAVIADAAPRLRRLTPARWALIAGFGIGGLLLCLSPGILRRASGDSADVVWSVYRLLGYSRMLYVLLLTLTVLKIGRRISLRDFFRRNSFFAVALASLLVFNLAIGIGELSGRQLFGVELYAGILTVRALRGVRVPAWLIAVAALAVAGLYAMKFDYLSKSNADIRAMRRELQEASDLRVCVDLHAYTSLVHPSELWNNYRLYEFVASSVYDDIQDHGHYYYNHKTLEGHPPYYGQLAVYPAVMKELRHRADKSYAAREADGMYLVVQDTLHPRHFVLERNLNILGFRRPKAPYEVDFDGPGVHVFDGMRVVYSDFPAPLTENGEILVRD